MKTLTNLQVNRILNRFVSKSPYPKEYLMYPYQSSQHITATNSAAMVFLHNSITSETFHNSYIDQKGIDSINRLIDAHITNHIKPSNFLTLDYKLLTSIIKSLKNQQAELTTKKTKTTVSYRKATNEIVLSTQQFNEPDIFQSDDDAVFFHPISVSNQAEDFNLTVDTNYLINSLMTQKETDKITSLECINHTKWSYLRLQNNISTCVIMPLITR